MPSWQHRRPKTKAFGSTNTSDSFAWSLMASRSCFKKNVNLRLVHRYFTLNPNNVIISSYHHLQMTATEQWIFLCAAHRTPTECSAIDYTRHTLDGAASLLNTNKYFPSRVSIKESSVNKLGSVCRRVYRIFSHAFFHHRQIFDDFEARTHLCKRFTVFVTKYNLMSKDNLIVPILETQDGPGGESEA